MTSPSIKAFQKKSLSLSILLAQASQSLKVRESELGFVIPSLADILTFAIRGFFVIAGILALFNLLLAGLAWITSGGEKESVHKAQNKIQAAIVGMIVIVAVLAVVVTFEQVVFSRRICFGLSCPVSIPVLLKPLGPEPANSGETTSTTDINSVTNTNVAAGNGALENIANDIRGISVTPIKSNPVTATPQTNQYNNNQQNIILPTATPNSGLRSQ